MQKSIMIFGIGKRTHLLDLFRNHCSRANLFLYGCDASCYAAARNYVNNFFLVPYANESNYVKRVCEVLEQIRPLGFLTIIDPEIVSLGVLSRTTSNDYGEYLNPCVETSLICEDKYKMYLHLKASGVPVVETSLEACYDVPYISKDRSGSCGSNCVVYMKKKDIISSSYKIFQPYMSGPHYCVDAYYDINTNELRECCVKEVIEKRNGEAYTLKTVQNKPFISLLEALGKSIVLKGIVNIDVYADNGRLVVMEVNARIGGNYPVSHLAGADFIDLLLRQLLNQALPEKFSLCYEIGSVFAKSFHVNKVM